MRHGRDGRLLILLTVAATAMSACGVATGGFAGSRSWAPLPEEVPMPESAPDDPAAYRGVRFRPPPPDHSGPDGTVWPPSVEAGGRAVPWLRTYASGYSGGPDSPYFGYQQVFDGRRRMVWFVRLVEPPVPVPPPAVPPAPPPVVATMAPPPRPGSTVTPVTAAPAPLPPPPSSPPPAPAPLPPEPPRAVLDVLVLPGAPEPGLEVGCGPDPVIIDGRRAWRLNRTTGRIEPVHRKDVACPKDD